jgi:hypothetical protein
MKPRKLFATTLRMTQAQRDAADRLADYWGCTRAAAINRAVLEIAARVRKA